MKRILILSTALTGLAFSASAQELTVMSWGGAYGEAQTEAHVKPFTAATGTPAKMVDSDNPATPIKAMVEAGNVTIDVASLEYADAIRLCDEGMLEPIDINALPAGADGTPAAEDFLAGAVTECAVSTDIWSNVYAYDDTKFTGDEPTTAADFFDLEKFPGKRGLKKGAKAVLELALMADGVPAAEVYDVLATPEGVDRAFAKLDTIKSEVVWWEAGSQAPQLLADGEVVMTTAYNGRIFNAAIAENKPFRHRLGWPDLRERNVCHSEGRAEQGRRDGVHQAVDLDRRSAGAGDLYFLWSGPQVGAGGRADLQGWQDRHGSAPADCAGEHDQCAGNLGRILGGPECGTERAVQRLAGAVI